MTRSAISVLAIDGGGMRGVIPAEVLRTIEERMKRPIADLFDLIAGTSTGGILALGLTKPHDGRPQFSAEDLLGFYTANGEKIFNKLSWHMVGAAGGLLHERYSVRGLEELVKQRFGDVMLSEALTELVVPTYDLTRPGPFFFKRRYARDTAKSWDVPFWQAARATSAAPTYFDPMALPQFPGDPPGWDHALVDGGVFANNPAACAYAEALDVFAPDPGMTLEIHVVSIGTGTPQQQPGHVGSPVPYERARGWGLAEWMAPMLHVVFDGVSKTVDHQMDLLCRVAKGETPHYHRIQGELREASTAMDDGSDHNIKGLLADAQRIVSENADELERVYDTLERVAAERDQQPATA